MEVWLLIAMLYGPQGHVDGVRILNQFRNAAQCTEEAQRAVEMAKNDKFPIGFACVPYKKPAEA